MSIIADTTSAGYTIPWDGVLDAVTEGSIIAFYSHTAGDGSVPASSQEAIVQYSRQQPGGGVCDPDD